MKLTKNELSIMEILWDSESPLMSSEIVDFSDDCEWKASSIHILINSLLAKKAIGVSGLKQLGKHYCRTFEPILTQEAYMVGTLNDQVPLTDSIIREMMLALVHDDRVSDETLDILDEIIKEKTKK